MAPLSYRTDLPAAVATEVDELAPEPSAGDATFAAGATYPLVYHPGDAGARPVIGHRLDKKLPEGAMAPAFGEKSKSGPLPWSPVERQRFYSRVQYEQMFAAEQGRDVGPEEDRRVRKGCVGITMMALGTDFEPMDQGENYGTFDQAHAVMKRKNDQLKLTDPEGKTGHYILFAKKFWSNQDGRSESPDGDPKAFLPDKNGRIWDMSEDNGFPRNRPGSPNFDYGFWDEASQSFWHANHHEARQPGDEPMVAVQSTKEHFMTSATEVYDRIVYGVALTKAYDPRIALEKAKGH